MAATDQAEVREESLRADLVELIETVILYKLPRLSREEIQTMLQVFDIRHTRVYHEAKQEGIQEGIEKGIGIGIARMAAEKMSAEQIAAILKMDVELVQRAMASVDRK